MLTIEVIQKGCPLASFFLYYLILSSIPTIHHPFPLYPSTSSIVENVENFVENLPFSLINIPKSPSISVKYR